MRGDLLKATRNNFLWFYLLGEIGVYNVKSNGQVYLNSITKQGFEYYQQAIDDLIEFRR